MNQIFDGTRIILCLTFLIYASWSDYKTREVSNKVWIILGPLELVLTGFQFLAYSSQPFQFVISYFLSFAVTSGLALIVFYLGGFGGADAKAFMCIALALPVYPNNLLPQPVVFTSPLFPLSIFSNSVLLGALTVFYALFRNLIWVIKNNQRIFNGLEEESFSRKIVALISGYKIKLTKLERDHMLPLEDVEINDDGKVERKLLTFPKYEESKDVILRLKENRLDSWVWVSPGLPLLIFITAGLVIGLFYGDIVWFLLGSVMT